MSITLLQKDSFHYAKDVVMPDRFKITSNYTGIDALLNVLDYKIYSKMDNKNSLIYFLKGRTGSGKSTCLPMSLLKHYHSEDNGLNIIVIEPRVILATGIPYEITKYDAKLRVGDNVGYITGGYKCLATNHNKLTFMTTDIFRMKYSQPMNKYPDFVLVDEVHTLDEPMINVLKIIKDIIYDVKIPKNIKPLFIFASATINLKMMINYFSNPLMNNTVNDIRNDFSTIGFIDGQRNFDVNTSTIDKENTSMEQFVKILMTDLMMKSVKSTEKLKDTNIICRDILIFCYGTRFIRLFITEMFDYLNKNKTIYPVFVSNHQKETDGDEIKEWRKKMLNKKRILILPYTAGSVGFAAQLLQSSLDPDDEARQNEIKVFITTNVLETGKTINTLYQVIDTGIKLTKNINPLLFDPEGKNMLVKVPVDKSASIQRCGRVGRKCKGYAYIYYTNDTYKQLLNNPYPENLLTISKAETFLVLRKDNMLDPVKNNDFIVPNSFDTNLVSMNDLYNGGFITPFGQVIDDIHSKDIIPKPWVIQAEINYYIAKMNVFEACLLARLERSRQVLYSECKDASKQNIDTVIDGVQNKNDLLNALYECRVLEAEYKYDNLHSVFKHLRL